MNRIWDLGFGIWDLRFGISGSGFQISNLKFEISDSSYLQELQLPYLYQSAIRVNLNFGVRS